MRNGKSTSISYKYIGRVVDLERKIFYSRSRQYFTYDIETDAFGNVPESFSPPQVLDRRKRIVKAFDFGDAFLLNAIMAGSGFWEIVGQIPWGNKARLRNPRGRKTKNVTWKRSRHPPHRFRGGSQALGVLRKYSPELEIMEVMTNVIRSG